MRIRLMRPVFVAAFATALVLVGAASASAALVTPTISAGAGHAVGLRIDGSVVATGPTNPRDEYGQSAVSSWTRITAIDAGWYHTIGVKSDGSVVATGNPADGRCNVSGWRSIKAVAAGALHTVGLKKDGTVVAVGDDGSGQTGVDGWADIAEVAAGGLQTIGLKSDGTVVAVGCADDNRLDVGTWSGISAVAAGTRHTVGLKASGSVVATGQASAGQCDVAGWSDVAAIDAGWSHTVGLRKNGTVIAAGSNDQDQCEVSAWTDIVAIAAGQDFTLGLTRAGAVLVAGQPGPNVSAWKLPLPGSFSGTVASSAGVPLGGVAVAIQGAKSATTLTTTGGKYFIDDIAPGAYTATFSAAGYAPRTYDIMVPSGSTLVLDVPLMLSVEGATLFIPTGGAQPMPRTIGKVSAKKGTTLTGSVSPAHATRVVVEIQVLSKKKFKKYRTLKVNSAANGTWKCKLKLKRGTYQVRIRIAADSNHLAGDSGWRRIVVK